ncbi:MAG: signal peptidase I [Chromatiales bacterium]|nr:signal peptidase I [Gammaproteobacteria bacterium]MCP5352698.1 signal peptidase I [Chromatiales bacterium]
MHLDFPTILTLACLITGVIWGIDAWLLAPKRQQLAQSADADEVVRAKATREPVIVEYARAFFPVILIVLLLRSFLVEPFRIPSGSMMPTLLVGDFIMVNKFTYGIRLPVINRKVIDLGAPERGDIAVFRFPLDPTTDYIKRVVGVPGDRIGYYRKVLYVNGQPQKLDDKGVYEGYGSGIRMSGARIASEQLGDVRHDVLIDLRRPDFNPGCNVLAEGEFTVPEGHYFAMGDNRDNSNDSRCWGTVPDENLVGKAFLIWFNWDSALGIPEWDRIGSSVE